MHKPFIFSPKNIRAVSAKVIDKFTMKKEKKDAASKEDTEAIVVQDGRKRES